MDRTDGRNNSDDNDTGEESPADAPGGAMMSIFASYYGIEDDVQSKRSPGDLIDSAHFDPNAFVKELLSTMTVEKLVSKDTSMVHEIRALDGDMQMLVYENYNKFISATETIKRMKNNVDAMDGDMEAVRIKMERISKTAHSIDETMAENRSKVDKLVRVRRLLSRLEFLSELPEKLSEMIEKEYYKDAVQLYSKTIRVLTSHSHVLSFKNIKERIEKMMQDLRGRVMNFLDDPSLEAVKLTQHVAVLRLMEAPRDKVVSKLLAAHKKRSLRMTKMYQQQLSAPTASPSPSTSKSITSASASSSGAGGFLGSAEASVLDSASDTVGSVSYARKFHQFLVVGLIEACKGITELFPDVQGTEGLRGAPSSSQGGAVSTVTGANVSGSQTAVQSALEAHTQLQSCLASVMLEYTKCLADSLKLFYVRYEDHLKICDAHESYSQRSKVVNGSSPSYTEDDISLEAVQSLAHDDGGSISIQTARTAQLRSYEFKEEKQAWMLLIRQTILDCQYLDKAAEECKVHHSLLPAGAMVTGEEVALHSVTFATTILAILNAHHATAFSRCVSSLVSSTSALSSEIAVLCDMMTEYHSGDSNPFGGRSTSGTKSRETSTHGLSSASDKDSRSVCSYPDPYLARTAVGQRTQLAKAVLDRVPDLFTSCFSDICADYRPIVEIYEIVNVRGKGRAKVPVICYSSSVLKKFVDGFCSAFEKAAGVSTSSFFGKEDFPSDFREDHLFKCGDIYPAAHSTHIKTGSDAGVDVRIKKGGEVDTLENVAHSRVAVTGDTDGRVKVCEFSSLAMSIVLRRISSSIVKRLNAELMSHELDPVRDSVLESQSEHRIDCSANALLSNFSESNSSYLAHLLSSAMYGPTGSTTGSTEDQDKGKDGEEGRGQKGTQCFLKDFSIGLDSLAIVCCILFGEAPPAAKMYSISAERDYSRRANTQKSGRTARAGLQLDIERLFAQQIRIFDSESLMAPSLDSVMATALKACLKSAQEHSRLVMSYPHTHARLLAAITLVKQMTGAVLRDTSGCDAIADQVLSSLQNRQVESSPGSALKSGGGWDDRDEVSTIFKIVSESMECVGRATVLLPKQ